MANISLKAKARTHTGHKVRELRRRGVMPIVTYGHGIKTQSLEVSRKVFEGVFAKAGSSTIVELDVDGTKKNVVIHDVQHDPVSGEVIHADLYQVRMDEKIKTEVPLKFIGTSRAVKDFGGILVKATDKLEVEALPADLPHEIEVDLSKLAELNATIKLADLKVPAGVSVLVVGKEFSIATVSPPRSEEELKALDEAVTEDVEAIEGVKKPEAEGEEAAVTAEGEKKVAGEKAEGGVSGPAGQKTAKPEAKAKASAKTSAKPEKK
ncbi:MAG: 50S ribosomal protein L25 [Parcubacteria group bacterium]